MGPLKALLRLIRGLLAFVVTVLVLVIVGISALAYLTVSGQDLTALRAVASGTGRLLAGQRTESLTLNVTAVPEQRSFTGAADLVMRSDEDSRQRFYFLLNEGMQVRRVHARLLDEELSPDAYRLGPLLVVVVGTPIGPEQSLHLRIEYDGIPTSGSLGSSIVYEPGRIRLPPDSLWYPGDAQSFFAADIGVTVPQGLTVVHNGDLVGDTTRGNLHTTRWKTARPIGGMALVAGNYQETALESDGVRYRLFTAPGERLDAGAVVALMAEADATLRSKLGPNGFPQVTAFVTHRLRRAFNDGSGVLALSNRYFRGGDYGFGLLAHELAHNWWGATVAEKWLSPGSGGEWIVEGFAEFSSIVAAETKFGPAAATLRLSEAFFDPAKQRVIEEMSIFDNSVAEGVSRDTIYRKGAYVAYMLRQIIGEPQYFDALSQFLERFRYQQASATDMQVTLEEITGLDLESYFADWIRSDKLADLAIEKTDDGNLEITNLGTAAIGGEIALWKFRAEPAPPEMQRVRVGDRFAADPSFDSLILDPLLEWADVERENNRFPRRSNPVSVAVSASGRILTTYGAPFAWVRATVREMPATAGGANVWDFTRGLAQPPLFGNDSELAVVAEATPEPLSSIATLSADGEKRLVGRGVSPTIASDAAIIAADDDRLVRWSADGAMSTILRRKGFKLNQPRMSGDGSRVAYVSHRGNDLELRIHNLEDGTDTSVLSWDGDRALYTWSSDDTRLYVGLGVGWDWQIWSVPLDPTQPTETLVAEAVAIGDLALSPDGRQLAFVAVPTLEYPLNRRRLYIQPLDGGGVRTFDVTDGEVDSVAWESPTSLLIVTRQWRGENPWVLPATRELQRVDIDDGSVSDL